MGKLIKMVILVVISTSVCAHAADISWFGGSGDWDAGGNWVGGAVPVMTNGTDNATISTGGTVQYNGTTMGGDFTARDGSQLILNGGSFEQSTTHWIRFENGGVLTISNGGVLGGIANGLVFNGAGASTVDGATSAVTLSGRNFLQIQYAASLSFTAGAAGTISNLTAQLMGGTLNVSDASAVTLKGLSMSTDTNGLASRINLSNAARLDFLGAASLTIEPDSIINFSAGYTGYLYLRGVNQASLEAMITAGNFAIGGVVNTSLASYKYVANGAAVNIGLVTPTQPPFFGAVVWTGANGDGQWYTGGNWAGGVVPIIDGTDDAEINGATVTYTPGGDMNWNNGSSLTLDGASLTQTTTHWTRFERGSTFTIINGGHLDFSRAKSDFRMRGTGAVTFTINNSMWSTHELFADDHITFALSNGATANLTGGLTQLQNGSLFDVTDSTLNLRNVQFQAYGGNATFINVNNGAQVNLLNTTSLGTNVIVKAGGSMINFAKDSTGSVFIDNITLAEIQTMIGESKFGIDGTISTNVTSYTITTDGTGQRISLIAPPPEEIGSIRFAYDNGDATLSWDSADGQDYTVQFKNDLVAEFGWNTFTNVVGTGTEITIPLTLDDSETFYRVISE